MRFGIRGILVFLLIYASSARGGDHRRIIVQDNDWEPFFYAGKKGLEAGLGKELLERCMPKADPHFFENFPLDRMFAEFKEGSLDVVVFSYKKDREEIALFSKEPLFRASYKPFVRADKNIKIISYKDFDGLRIGGKRGLKYSEDYMAYLKARFPKDFNQPGENTQGEFWQAQTDEALINGLLTDRIDIFVNTAANARLLAEKMGVATKIKEVEFFVQKGDYFLAVSRNAKYFSADAEHKQKLAYIADFDNCLKNLKASKGEIDSLYRRYGYKDEI